MTDRRRLILAALALPLARPALAQAWFAARGLALRGHDPVAYFAEARPRRGEAGLSLDWGGVEWRFATQANRLAFIAEPERYAPQYGGWCAWAMAEGYLAPIDPMQWRIVDGRL